MNSKVLRYFQECGVPCVCVSGSSMNPAFSDGDIVQTVQRSPRTGDVVIFRRNDVLFIHRVIFRSGNSYYTMGDNSSFPDHPVAREDILGVVPGNSPGSFTVLSRLKALFVLLKHRLRHFRSGR